MNLWTDSMRYVLFPFANYYNSNTVKAVAIALGIYAMAIVIYYTSQRNYMPGKEFWYGKI